MLPFVNIRATCGGRLGTRSLQKSDSLRVTYIDCLVAPPGFTPVFHGLLHHLRLVSFGTAWPGFDSVAMMVPTNVAISLREMSLVRCTLHNQGQLPFSGSVDDVVLRIAPEFHQQWAGCKARLDGARRLL